MGERKQNWGKFSREDAKLRKEDANSFQESKIFKFAHVDIDTENYALSFGSV